MIQRNVLRLIRINDEKWHRVTFDELVQRHALRPSSSSSSSSANASTAAGAIDAHAAASEDVEAEADGEKMRFSVAARNPTETGSDAMPDGFGDGNRGPAGDRHVCGEGRGERWG